MLEGMREYEKISEDLNRQIVFFEEGVAKMEGQLEQLRMLDSRWKGE